MKDISVTDLDAIIQDTNSKIIDLRDNYIYQLGTIPTAINIPSNFLMTMPEEYLDHSTYYYLFCDYGVKSSKVVRYLRERGYHVYNINGGYHEYSNKLSF